MTVDLSNPIPTFLSLKELAGYLNISVRAARRLVDNRQIAFHKIGGSLRFKREDIFQYLEKQRIDQLS